MMNGSKALGCLVLIGLTLNATAGDFANTSQEMLDGLTTPPPENTLKLRGMTLRGAPAAAPKMRSVTVIEENEGIRLRKTTAIPVVETRPSIKMQVLFDFNSATIRHDSYPLLDKLGRVLNDPKLGQARLSINGHTDSVGGDEYNLELSFKRARAVRDYLRNHHQVGERLTQVQGYGESMPRFGNTSDYGRQQNRRVEIVRIDPLSP